jgi:hypothetical protein
MNKNDNAYYELSTNFSSLSSQISSIEENLLSTAATRISPDRSLFMDMSTRSSRTFGTQTVTETTKSDNGV